MTLSADEFIRRFLLHALPDGFHRIRHYGLLANGHRVAKLASAVFFWRRPRRRRRTRPPTIASVAAVSQDAPWTSVRAAAAPWPRSARSRAGPRPGPDTS